MSLRLIPFGLVVATTCLALPWLRAATAQQVSSVLSCAEAVALSVLPNRTVDGSFTDFATKVADVLQQDARCSYTQPAVAGIQEPAGQKTVVTWTQYPAWYNGLLSCWFPQQQQAMEQLGAPLVARVASMPEPKHVTAGGLASFMTDFESMQDHFANFKTGDLSGYSPFSIMDLRDDVLGTPENECMTRASAEGPLHPRTYLLMWYRKDALAALQAAGRLARAQPPASWDELLELLRVHKEAVEQAERQRAGSTAEQQPPHGGPGGLPRHGLCITENFYCGRAPDVLAAIAASVVQSGGVQTAYAFDLSAPMPKARPLVNSTAWRYAAGLMRQLLSYNADPLSAEASDDPLVKCQPVATLFTAGECMVTLEWDSVLAHMTTPALSAAGVLGVAPLPGSSVVLDRSGERPGTALEAVRRELLPCTRERCAVSVNHDLLYLDGPAPWTAQQLDATMRAAAVAAAALPRTSPLSCHPVAQASVESTAAAALEGAEGGLPRDVPLVNRAPYSAFYGGFMKIAGEREHSDPDANRVLHKLADGLQSRLRTELSYRRAATDAMRAAVQADSQTRGLVATPWWAAVAQQRAFNVSGYVRRLVHPDAANAALRAVWHGIHSPNAAPDVQAPCAVNWYKWALGNAVLQMVAARDDPAQAAADAEALVTAATAELRATFDTVCVAYGASNVRYVYSRASGFSIDSQAKMQRDEMEKDSKRQEPGGFQPGYIAAIVVGALAVVLLPATLVLCMRRDRSQRDFLGRVRAPRAGPDTTLLVTDVQNSTVLWEELPADCCMDVALRVHHTTIRQLLREHDGYESATEGDSFICAFASPAAALAFAAAAQAALLAAPWPAQLLEHRDGSAVMVEHVGPAAEGRAAPRTDSNLRSKLRQITGRRLPSNKSPWVMNPRALSITSHRAVAVSPAHSPVPGSPRIARLVAEVVQAPAAGPAPAPRMLCDPPSGPPPHDPPAWTEAPPAHGTASPRPLSAAHVLLMSAAEPGGQHQDRGPTSVGYGGEALPFPWPGSEVGSAFGSNPGRAPSVLRPQPTSHASGALGCLLDELEGEGSNPSYNATAPSWDSERGDVGQGAEALQPCVPWSKQLAGAFKVALGCEEPEAQESNSSVFATLKQRATLLAADGAGTKGQGVVAYRGMRVRMGIHCGLDDPRAIVFDKVNSTFKYQGSFADTATLVSDAAPGGLVTLSAAAFTRLRNSASAASCSRAKYLKDVLLVYAGHHLLKEAPPAVPGLLPPAATGGPGQAADAAEGCALYVAVHRALACRLVLSPALRTVRLLQLPTLSAPTNCITVAFMKVVGASTLLSELPGPAARALEAFQRATCGLLMGGGGSGPSAALSPNEADGCGGAGYLVEGGGGLVLAAFGSPWAAIAWALRCVERLKTLDYDEELLNHELCSEALSLGVSATAMPPLTALPADAAPPPGDAAPPPLPECAAPPRRRRNSVLLGPGASPSCHVLERGLRVKVGVDIGPVSHMLTESSGRLSYRGKVMNRAARICGVAGPGQVLASGAAWNQASVWPLPGVDEGELVGVSLGKVTLKGIGAPVEVVQCMRGAGGASR